VCANTVLDLGWHDGAPDQPAARRQ
jgi:hypothetical protein